MRTSFLILWSLLLATSTAQAKVGSVQLSNLVAKADLIVIAKVETVVTPSIGNRYAHVRVSEIWKGKPEETLTLQIWPRFMCDTSTALEGETVLLFLQREVSGTYRIAHSGRGRLTIRTIDARNYVRIRYKLPDELQNLPTPHPSLSDGYLDLPTLQRHIEELIRPRFDIQP